MLIIREGFRVAYFYKFLSTISSLLLFTIIFRFLNYLWYVFECLWKLNINCL